MNYVGPRFNHGDSWFALRNRGPTAGLLSEPQGWGSPNCFLGDTERCLRPTVPRRLPSRFGRRRWDQRRPIPPRLMGAQNVRGVEPVDILSAEIATGALKW